MSETGDDTQSTAAELPDQEVLYRALSNKRRRYSLHYLKQRDGPVAVRDLAEQVAAWENDKSISALTSQERKRVYIALYQSHLDTMASEGLIEYDSDEGTVRLADAMADVDLYLEVVQQSDVPWSLYYAGLSLANAVLLVLAWLAVPPFDAVPDLGWGAIVLVSFAASAFVQHFRGRQMRIGDEGAPPELTDL